MKIWSESSHTTYWNRRCVSLLKLTVQVSRGTGLGTIGTLLFVQIGSALAKGGPGIS